MLSLLYAVAIFQSISLKMCIIMDKFKCKFQKYIELKLTAVIIVLSVLKCFIFLMRSSFFAKVTLGLIFQPVTDLSQAFTKLGNVPS